MDNKKQSTEHHEPKEENLVQDLKKSIEDTLNETQFILDDLKETVETTIKDESISEATKKIVESISNEIKNSIAEDSKKIIDTIKTTKAIDAFEEE